MQTIRRTIRFEFTRRPDGSYIAYPKVLIETSAIRTPDHVAGPIFAGVYLRGRDPNIINDQGVSIPPRYWYSLGRDEAMEKERRIPCVKNWANDQKARRPADSIRQGFSFLNPPMTNTLHPPNNPSMNASYFAENSPPRSPTTATSRPARMNNSAVGSRFTMPLRSRATKEPPRWLRPADESADHQRHLVRRLRPAMPADPCIADANPEKIVFRLLDQRSTSRSDRDFSTSTPATTSPSPYFLPKTSNSAPPTASAAVDRYLARSLSANSAPLVPPASSGPTKTNSTQPSPIGWLKSNAFNSCFVSAAPSPKAHGLTSRIAPLRKGANDPDQAGQRRSQRRCVIASSLGRRTARTM